MGFIVWYIIGYGMYIWLTKLFDKQVVIKDLFYGLIAGIFGPLVLVGGIISWFIILSKEHPDFLNKKLF